MIFKKYKKTGELSTLTKAQAKETTELHQFKGKYIPLISSDDVIETLEGPQKMDDGDLLCKGVIGELWSQPESKVNANFTKNEYQGNRGMTPWTRWTPKGTVVEAALLMHPVSVSNDAGKHMSGEVGDYMVRRPASPEDTWIVQGDIFEKSYTKE